MLRVAAGVLLLGAAAWAGEDVLWSGEGPLHLGAPSPDGRYFSGVEPSTGALIVRDLKTGAIRNVTGQTGATGEFAYFSVFSRDGGRIAYAWFNGDGFYELRVVPAGGGAPRSVYANQEAGFVQPCAWSADGQWILTLLFRADNVSQIALVPTAGGAPRVLKTLRWVYPNRMDLSPDGRFVVYDNFSDDGAAERDVFALAVDGSRELRVAGGAANDVFPVFRPDGGAVIFLSDRTGRTAVWEQPFPSGTPRLLRDNVGRALALGITRDGVFHYARRSGGTEIYLADVDWPAGRVRAEARRAGEGTAPAWSPDGASLAWLSRVGTENSGQPSRAITVSGGGQTRTIAPRLAHLDGLRWTPDGARLLVDGMDRHGRRGGFAIDPVSGEGVPVAGVPRRAERGGLIAFHEDGQVYVCCGEGKERRRLAAVRNGTIDSLEWLPDGSALLMGTTGKTRRLWRVALEGGSPQALELALDRMGPVSVNPADGRLAYAAGGEWTEVRAMRLSQKE